MKPLLSIIIPTIGRESLGGTLASIPDSPEIEIVTVADGQKPICLVGLARLVCLGVFPRLGNFGHSAFNVGQAAATGDWLCRMDDDDYYAPGGVEAMLQFCRSHPLTDSALFRMRWPNGEILWRKPELLEGNVGSPMFLCPRCASCQLGTRYAADFDWIVEASKATALYWVDQVTAIIPKVNQGK